MYENVNLFFAKDNRDNLIMITEINDVNKNEPYSCAVCGSELRPKAINSIKVSPHFAHVDASSCDSEAMIHWWYKNKFIQKGDSFNVKTNGIKKYICKDIIIEKPIKTSHGNYKPDLIIETECGSEIYFEMNNKNQKKIEDYLDKWIELNNTVVEVNIKDVIGLKEMPTLKAIFYKGKCFNTKKNDMYYNTIGKYKEGTYHKIDSNTKERMKKLDWVWNDIFRYKSNQISIDILALSIDAIEDKKDKEIVREILCKKTCGDIIYDYLGYKSSEFHNKIKCLVQRDVTKEFLEECVKPSLYGYRKESLESGIKVLNKLEGEWTFYESDDYASEKDLKKLKTTLENLQKEYVKYNYLSNKINDYNKKLKLIKELLMNNHEINDYKNTIPNNYSIDLVAHSYNATVRSCREEHLDDFRISFELKFKDSRVSESKINLKVEEIIDHEEFCLTTIHLFNNYLDKLDRLSDAKIKRIKFINDELNDEYSRYEIDFYGNLWSEDKYTIYLDYNNMYKKTLYITNDYITIKGIKEEIERVPYSTIDELKTVVNKLLTETFHEESGRWCVDCSEKYTLSFGEFKFYKDKGFTLPKRCKSCRNKRKQNKGGN